MVTWGSENRVVMTSKRFQKRIRNGGRVRKKLQREGAMNQINVQMSARSLGFYLCCMIKNFFKKNKRQVQKGQAKQQYSLVMGQDLYNKDSGQEAN